jgi:hypothetical protein
MMDRTRALFESLNRDPSEYPLFHRVYQVLCFAPSSKHAQENEIKDLAWDALDYLQQDGKWQTQSTTGATMMRYDGRMLAVHEHDGDNFAYDHTFTVNQ